MSKRGKAARKSPGGRYTPPGTKNDTPKTRRAEAVARAAADTPEAFAAAVRAADRELRARCDRLLAAPPSDAEWSNAGLIDMDGEDASDAELVAYWRLYRHVTEKYDDDFPPELADITGALADGKDPITEWDNKWADIDDDKDQDEDEDEDEDQDGS